MKTLAALAAGLLLSAGSIAPAHAFTPGGPFTLIGPANIAGVVSVACTASFTATGTPGAGGMITGVVFTGGAGVCSLIHATNLPWAMTPTSTSSVQVSNVGLTFPATCGPATVTADWDNTTGRLSLSNAAVGSCHVSWALSSNPPQTLP